MELTLVAMLEAMGGWEVVIRTGAVVAFAWLLQEIIKASGKVESMNKFIKLSTAFIASAVIAFAWCPSRELIARDTFANLFFSTFVWVNAVKPLIKKFGKDVTTE